MSLPATTVPRLYRGRTCWRCANQLRIGLRSSSTTPDAPPPLLSKIKEDMKAAMRAKDKERLAVIRAIISDTNQLASGPSPIKTDMQVLALLKKRKAASRAAAREAEEVQRDDLKQKQEKEIEILDEYAGTVELVAEEELREMVEVVREKMRLRENTGPLNPGSVMKELLQGGGALEGRPVDKALLAGIVKDALQNTAP